MMSLFSLFRTPSTEPGRRYSYHRAILLVAGLALLFLFRPALPGPATEAVDQVVATAVLGGAAVALAVSVVAARWRGR